MTQKPSGFEFKAPPLSVSFEALRVSGAFPNDSPPEMNTIARRLSFTAR